MCLYSTEMNFTQHKHDKSSSQVKAQKPVVENIFERNVKLPADLRRIRGTRDSVTISIGKRM